MSMVNMALDCLIFLLQVIVCVSFTDDNKCADRCCINFYEDANGKCVECTLGTHGVDCNNTCSPGYFGRLCVSLCDCPADQCDRKYGCNTDSKVDSTDQWMNVALALIGSVSTLGVIGLLIFLRSWFAKRGNSQRDMNNSLRENHTNPDEDEHRYEYNRSLPPSDGVEDDRPHLQADENIYTDLRFSCMYDNPFEGEEGPKIGTLPNAAATLFCDNDLTSSDGECDDSSEENDVIESYEHLQCPVPSQALYVQYPYCGDSVRW